MNIVLYSTGCPRCKVLEKKLESSGFSYEKCTDVDQMVSMGLREAPVLEVDGVRMEFTTANRWLNSTPREVE